MWSGPFASAFSWLRHIFADGGYAGPKLAEALAGRRRRLAKDWEKPIESATAWTNIASIRLISRRIAGALISLTDF